MLKKDNGKRYYTPKGDIRAEHFEAEVQQIPEVIEDLQQNVEMLADRLDVLEDSRPKTISSDKIGPLMKEVADLRKCYSNLVHFLQEVHPDFH
jgi:archaellum component FlaC